MRLYGLAAATDANALLQLYLSDRTILLHFKRGAPELIDSTHPHDALPAFLMAQGLATPAQLEAAEAQKARFGGELLPALFGLGLVNPNLVFQQIAERATAILFRALSAEQGSFTFQAQELPPHKSLPLGNRWALYLEQLRRVPAADVRRRMMAFMGLPVMRTGGAVTVAVGDLKLQPQEARALQFFDGVRSLNQLVGDHPMEADVLVRVAWMLRELELVAFEGTPVSASAPSAEPPMVPPSVAPSGIRTPPPGSLPSAPPPTASAPPPVRGDPPPGPPVMVATMAPGPPVMVASDAPHAGPVVGVAAASGAPSSRPPSPGVAAPPGAPPSGRPVVGVAAPPGAPSGRPVAPPGSPPIIGVPPPPGAPAGRPMMARTVLSAAEPEPPILKPAVASTVPGGPVQAPPRQAVPYPQRQAPGASTAPASPARPSPVASSPSVKPSTPPTGIAPTDDVAQLTALLERAKKQSYFELLNVPREADATAAKVAYFKLAKIHHPDTVPPGSPEALGRLKADLFALIGEAHRTLSDPRLKQDYIAELDSGAQGEKVDVAQLLLAEELFQRGRMLVKARKWADAVKVLDDAIAANAQEGEYFGWRGFARFFLHEDKAKAHPPALRDMEYALKLNPNAAAVHYFQGYLWKMMGDLGRAKPYFRRCVELDPRHIDAQRELRMMK